MNKAADLLERFRKFPLLAGATALEPMPRLSKKLGGPQLYVKRDDCTGLAFGGNKTRKLEYVLADAISQGADVLITTGGPQSNHARQTAAAASRAGMGCDLLLAPFPAGAAGAQYESGNLLLDRLLGATIHRQVDEANLTEGMLEIARQRRQAGHVPYLIDAGASSALGTLGYVSCALEMHDQAMAMGIEIDCIVQATGSCGTQAGLLAGLHLLGSATRVMGFEVSRLDVRDFRRLRVGRLATEVLSLAEVVISPDELEIALNDAFCGPGYGVPDQATLAAIELLATTEGLLLDPVYTGKAMAGLIDSIRRGRYASEQSIVFLHTGGAPALFASAAVLESALDSSPTHRFI
jgi:L-cysteate sulfo-lyase